MTSPVTPADLDRWAEMHADGTCSCQPWPCPVHRLVTHIRTQPQPPQPRPEETTTT